MQKIKIIGSLLAYLILASISCWATEKSLHMLLPATWPEVLVWGIVIAFFVVASIGSWLIVKVLTSNDYIEHRVAKLVGGILLMLFFWLIMSMPTNTHTFFYNDQIASVVTKDIENTNKYLDQIVKKVDDRSIIYDEEGKKLKTLGEKLIGELKAEFNGEGITGKKGDGKEVNRILGEFNTIFNCRIQQIGEWNGQDPTKMIRYESEMRNAMDIALKPHVIKPSEDAKEKANAYIQILDETKKSLNNDLTDGTLSEKQIRTIQKILEDSYVIIDNNKTYVDFDSKADRDVFTNPKHETRTKRMASVIDVFFVDFLNGKYPGSFWYFILLSILVDVAAFIFFDVFFKNLSEEPQF